MEYFVLLCYVYVIECIKRYWPYAAALLIAFFAGMCTRIMIVGQ